MELRQLRYLIAVAEEASFTRAADKLYVTQSALSQQIQALEHELGAALLDRSRRGVRLTAAGEILCQHARRSMRELDEARIAIEELEGLQRGALTIGAVQTVNAYLMPSLVAEFATRYPAVRLSIQELSADAIEDGLREGVLQIGLGFAPPTGPDIEAEWLFEEALVLLVPPGHALANITEIDVAALDDVPMVMLSRGFCTRRLWDKAARSVGIEPRITVEMNTVASILSAVEQTGLPTVLPEMALALVASGALQRVTLCNPSPTRSVGLLTARGAYLCAAARAFADITREAVANRALSIG